MTLNRKADAYKDVTAASFVRCVLEAAEVGLAIDGKLAHAVVFNNKVKKDGKEVWVAEAQLMIDYKGLIAVAKRTGQIKDAWARLVCENDEFEIFERDGENHYFFKPALTNPGFPIGCIAIVLTDHGPRFEWMDMLEIDAIRARSKSWTAKDKQGKHSPKGPWVTDDGEMRKKTVIRRALKLYCDDPAMSRLMDFEDRDYEASEITPEKVAAMALPVGRHHVGRALPPAPTPEYEPAGEPVEQGETEEPGQTEPSGPPTAEELEREDLVNDLTRQIEAAQPTQMNAVGEALKAAKETIGDVHFDRLMKAFQARTNSQDKGKK